MPRILLVRPNLNYPVKGGVAIFNRIWPPLSLANCAAILERGGFFVKIIDANALGLSLEEVSQKAKNFDKVFVTSSTLDKWQCPHLDLKPFLKTVEKIRGNSPEVYVMGTNPTVMPEKILKLTKVKAVIRHEPEEIVLAICQGKNLSKVKGITYKDKKGKIKSNPDAAPPNLANFPLPAFHLLPMEKYSYDVLGKNFTLFEGSRGCPFNCIFCLKKVYQGYRKKPVENLIKEVKYAIENFGIKTAYFIDLEFTINKDTVEKLCDFLIDKNYDFIWCCQTRADSVNEKLLKKMKQAGCKLIHYGVETGSPKILKSINKKITKDKIRKGVNLTHQVGIETACFFMFGFPNETREDMEKTIQFAKELNPTYASFHLAYPYQGTEFYQMVKNDLKEEEIAYTKEHSLEELLAIKRKAFFSFYLRSSYILSRLKKGEISSLINQFKLFLGYVTREKI